MIFSLLNGHETALEALWKFLEMACYKIFRKDSHLCARYSVLIDVFFSKSHRNYYDFQRFSEEQRGEIATMILKHCGMTIEEVESRITAFRSTPPK